ENLLYKKIAMETYSHNNFIELLVGVGLIGFLIYYSIYFYIFYHLFKLTLYKKIYALVLFILFLTWFIAEFGAVNYTNKMTYILFGLTLAYINLSEKNKEKV